MKIVHIKGRALNLVLIKRPGELGNDDLVRHVKVFSRLLEVNKN